MQIDLHNMSYFQAIRYFIKKYNEILKSGKKEPLVVIHGYGASGKGGVIKRNFQNYLNEHTQYLSFYPNSDITGINQGCTTVFPKKTLPVLTDILEDEILDYCSTSPKSMEKITGVLFKKYDEKKIKSAVKSLVKKGGLTETLKKRSSVYLASKGD